MNAGTWFRRAVVGGLVTAVAAVAVASALATSKVGNPYNLKDPSTLVVGMNLQYKPEMYLDAKGKPAGYDVVLLKALAAKMKVKLKIQNLDFNGLIPGLVGTLTAGIFMVSQFLKSVPRELEEAAARMPEPPSMLLITTLGWPGICFGMCLASSRAYRS